MARSGWIAKALESHRVVLLDQRGTARSTRIDSATMAGLADPERHVRHRWDHLRGSLVMPGIRVGDAEGHVVWGLTYRFVECFLDLMGCPIPDRWDPAVVR